LAWHREIVTTVRRLWRQLVPAIVGVIVAAVAVGVIVVAVKWAPDWLADTEGLGDTAAAEELGRVRTAILAGLAGLLAALGAYYTHRTFALNRAGQITERFTRAIDQLGNAAPDVRLGGIYALERIAGDSADDHPQVVEVLTAYVREHAPLPPPPAPAAASGQVGPKRLEASSEAILALVRIARCSRAAFHSAGAVDTSGETAAGDTKGERPRVPTDVRAAVSVLGRRDISRDRKGAKIRLQDVDLHGVSMRGGHFEEARLRRSHLEGAHLEGAQLQGAKLRDAHLELADLGPDPDLKLQGANLEGASLQGANLQGAKLKGARFKGAVYDTGTTWPKGFDYKAAGARQEKEREPDSPSRPG
jgi:hypothetical protein